MSRETRVEAHRLAAWRDEFLAAGTEGLKARPRGPDERRLADAKRKVGGLTMELEVWRAVARAPDPATEAAEVSAETGIRLAVVCRVPEALRSTSYARRIERAAAKRGPRTDLSDGQLTELVRAILEAPTFAGEGYRKLTARLRREYRVFVGRNRVLRLIRAHDGTIIPRGPNRIWGTDVTMTYTTEDSWAWAFVCVDHFTAEA